MKINVPELKKTGAALGLLLVGAIGANAVLKDKLNTLPITGAVCIGSAVASTMVENSLVKNALMGVSVFSGLKMLSLAVNGSLKGLGSLGDETGEEKGVKFIPETVKATLRKFIPSLSGDEDGEVTPEAITLDTEVVENISGLFSRKLQQAAPQRSITTPIAVPGAAKSQSFVCHLNGFGEVEVNALV